MQNTRASIDFPCPAEACCSLAPCMCSNLAHSVHRGSLRITCSTAHHSGGRSCSSVWYFQLLLSVRGSCPCRIHAPFHGPVKQDNFIKTCCISCLCHISVLHTTWIMNRALQNEDFQVLLYSWTLSFTIVCITWQLTKTCLLQSLAEMETRFLLFTFFELEASGGKVNVKITLGICRHLLSYGGLSPNWPCVQLSSHPVRLSFCTACRPDG